MQLSIKDIIYNILIIPKRILDRGKIMFYDYRFRTVQKQEIFELLSRAGYKKVEPYKEKEWALFPVFKIYYRAEKQGVPVFIKIGDYQKVIEREVGTIRYMREKSEYLCNVVPNVIDYNVNGKYPYLAENFLIGDSPEQYTKEQVARISDQVIEIWKELNRIGVMHMDIRRKNVLADRRGNVFLIDFGMSYVKEMAYQDCVYAKGILPRKFWGLGGKKNPGRGMFDDAYSILMYLKEIYPDFKKDFKDKWIYLNQNAGKLVYTFNKVPRRCK